MLHIEAVLMHIGQFVKDNTLHFSSPSKLQAWQSLLQNKLCGLVPKSQIHLLENTPSSTRLKEGIAMAAEPSNNLLLVYYAGCVVLRKDRLYLATTESTAALAHVNAVPVEQVLDILQESNAKRILWLVDASYRQEQSEQSAFAVWKETLQRYPQLRTRLSCGLILQPVEERQHTSPIEELFAQISQGLPDMEQEKLSLHDFWQHSLSHAPGTLWLSEVEQPLQWIANAHLLRRQQAENWIAEAAHYFEVDKFEKALLLYQQAAEVLPSEQLSEAIDQCERWIRKEQAIRSRMEEQLWSHVRVWDTTQGYAFYLNVFPEGSHKEKAQSCIQVEQPAVEQDLALQLEQPKSPSQPEQTLDELIDRLADAPILEPLISQITERLGDEVFLQEPAQQEQVPVFDSVADAPAFTVAMMVEDAAVTEQPVEEFVQEVEIQTEVQSELQPEQLEVQSELQPEQSESQVEVGSEAFTPVTLQQDLEVEVVPQLELLPEGELMGMSEIQLWDYVRQVNTVVSYRTYLSLSRENSYIKDAYYAIHQLGREDLPDPEPLVVTPIQQDTPQVVPSDEQDSQVVQQDTPQAVQSDEQDSQLVQLDEEALWAEAQAQDTIAAYMLYLNRSSENRYIPNAYARISALKLLDGRKPVQQEPVVVSHQHAPSETHTQEVSLEVEVAVVEEDEVAKVVFSQVRPVQVDTPTSPLEPTIDRTAGPEEEQLWQKALADHTLSAYFNYLNRTTEKTYWAEAKQRIAQLKEDTQAKEEQEWKKTCQANTIEAYKQYVKRYPLGNYYAQATVKINSFNADLQ